MLTRGRPVSPGGDPELQSRTQVSSDKAAAKLTSPPVAIAGQSAAMTMSNTINSSSTTPRPQSSTTVYTINKADTAELYANNAASSKTAPFETITTKAATGAAAKGRSWLGITSAMSASTGRKFISTPPDQGL